MDKEQQIQEDEYMFPYHYVSQFKPYFGHFFKDGWGINYVSTIEFLLEKLDHINFKNIVDIGCGDGRMTRDLKEKFPEIEVTGIDYSSRAIQLGKAMNSSNINFKKSDILEDEFDTKWDVGILMEVFEHIPLEQTNKFIASISEKLLKPGATLLVTVPHENKPLEAKHYQHFNSQKIRKYFEEYFKIEEFVYFEKIGFTKSLLNLALTNRFFLLNHIGLRKKIYSFYKRSLFICDETNCGRLFVKLRNKES